MTKNICVIGGGSWGTALAGYGSEIGHNVTLWALEEEVVEDINTNNENSRFLPGATLNSALKATTNLEDALQEAEIVFSVVPTQFLKSVISKVKGSFRESATIVSASKGIENGTLLTPVEIYQNQLRERSDLSYAAFAGPSFAKEVIRRVPTVVVVASEDEKAAKKIQHVFSSPVLRIYTSTDIHGVEICGAIKNVLAIASGIINGLGMGDNTRAALITRGIAEITRLVKAIGGQQRTVAGMAGIGDIVLTCTSSTSRNYSVGQRLGSGESLQEITSSMNMVAEGVATTKSVHELAKREKVDLPISMAMYQILYAGLNPRKAVQQLMSRELKHEWETE